MEDTIESLRRELDDRQTALKGIARAIDAMLNPVGKQPKVWTQMEHREPVEGGWYRVMISGDSETDGAHVYYSYPDYETWALWTEGDPEAQAEKDDGWEGQWSVVHDEPHECVFAYAGPVRIPIPFKDEV